MPSMIPRHNNPGICNGSPRAISEQNLGGLFEELSVQICKGNLRHFLKNS